MRWPDPTDYNDAIQIPSAFLNDPELKQCEVAADASGLPRVASGNFASVYRLNHDGQSWAVKCFLRNIPERHERYKRITEAVAQSDIPYLISCEYQDKGICIGNNWFPILKMPWLEGLQLNEFVERYVSHPRALEVIALEWLKVVRGLRSQGMAHGDLQHGNVMIVNRRLRLIDYDGMYISAFEGEKPTEQGHPEYQHPRRTNQFGPDLDTFSALTVYTALRALSYEPRLWEPLNTGENMLFRRADYDDLNGSAVFQTLSNCPFEEVKSLCEMLMDWGQRDMEEGPNLTDLLSQQSLPTVKGASHTTMPRWLAPLYPDIEVGDQIELAESHEKGKRTAPVAPRVAKPTTPKLLVQTATVNIGEVAADATETGYVWWSNCGTETLTGTATIQATTAWLTFEDGSTERHFTDNTIGWPIVADGTCMIRGQAHVAEIVIASNGGSATVQVSAKCEEAAGWQAELPSFVRRRTLPSLGRALSSVTSISIPRPVKWGAVGVVVLLLLFCRVSRFITIENALNHIDAYVMRNEISVAYSIACDYGRQFPNTDVFDSRIKKLEKRLGGNEQFVFPKRKKGLARILAVFARIVKGDGSDQPEESPDEQIDPATQDGRPEGLEEEPSDEE